MTKRFYGILVLLLCVSVLALAAGKETARVPKSIPQPELRVTPSGAKVMPSQPIPPPPATEAVGTYTTLQGWWDYQSNGGDCNYIEVDPATGYINVITMVQEQPDSPLSAAATRGTRFARSTNDGVTWMDWDPGDGAGGRRVPPERSGYPSLGLYRGSDQPGAPLVISHGGETTQSNPYIGIAADSTLPAFASSPPLLAPPISGGEPIWPKVTSGVNGEVVVLGSVNNTVVGTYTAYLIRTTDLGNNWSGNGLNWLKLPSADIGGGQYAIASNNSGRIAVVGGTTPSVGIDSLWLWESTNNGATWPANMALITGPNRVVEGESVHCSYTMDVTYNGNTPLVAFNSSRWIDGGLFFAGSRIEVWSPTLGFKVAAPWDSLLYPSTLASEPFNSILSYPSIAMSGSNIVVAYHAFLNNDNTVDTVTGHRYCDIFLTQSTDGGNTWALPVNVTNTPQLDEKYASISNYNPAGFAYMVWQEDTRAGFFARFEDDSPRSIARQKFLKVNLTTIFPLNDITALSVTFPAVSNALLEGSSFTPKAAFRNIGLAGQSNIPVKYQILNLAGTSVLYENTQTISSLSSTATTEVTFASVSGSLLTAGQYRTRAIVSNPGDVQGTNDTTLSAMWVIPVITVNPGTTTETFEDTAPETGGFGWYSGVVGSTSPADWVRGTPTKTQISHAWSGTKCMVTKTSGNYSDGMESILGSPSYNMSAYTGNVRVEFYQNFVVEPLWDGMWLQYSTNGGATWNVADHSLASGPTWNTASSTGWYNAAIDSQVVAGAPEPPMWGDSTVLYTGNVDGWIKSATSVPVGGYSDVRFRFYFSADANQNREGWAIDDFTLKVGSGTANVPYNNGWNMIANPVQKPVNQDSVRQLYPASVFDYVFGFGASGYFQTKKMPNGPGYWGKFSGTGSAAISGGSLLTLSAPVIQGWNMIGSMTASIDTANIYPSPYGSRASVYFGYNGGYTAAASLNPGKAYWVKSSAAGGFLYLPPAAGAPANKVAANPLAALNTLTVKDAIGNSTTLYFGGVEKGQVDVAMYEMPPVPPSGAFDARFETADAGYMVQTHERGALTGEFPVRLQSAVYPVTVSWNVVSDAGYRLRDGLGNKAFGSREMRGTGSMVIRNNAVNRLIVGIGGEALPTEFALLQNYPNPFNPSTTIKFALPEPSRVTVEIFNLLGQRVTTLVSEQMPAGFHEVKWEGTTAAGQLVGSGIYFARFNAVSTDGKNFSDVRKLMLMK